MQPEGVAVYGAVIVLVLGIVAFCVAAIIDVLRRPERQWRGSGQNQIMWIAIVIGSWFVGLALVGALLYWFIARPALKRVDGMRLAS